MSNSILRKASIAGPALALHIVMLLCSQRARSQSPVLQFTANYVSAFSGVNSYTAFPTSPGTFSSCNTNNYTYTWSNGVANQLKLVSFTANSKTYVVAGTPGVLVKLRRVNNAVVTGTRNILYSETTAATATSCPSPYQLDFKAPYSDDMAAFLNNNVLNHGTDNLFTNASNGDGNNNNIERVDVVFTGGIQSSFPADAGFILCERGGNNAHDGFRIAAILTKNGSNDPTSFGSVKICTAGNGSNNGSWGHPTLASGNKVLAAYVLRKDAADSYLRVSSNVNQELGGVFFSLSDLGVAANQTIYGYTLLGPDGTANPTSAQLLNTSDAAIFPTGTTEAQGGGLDLISINTFYGTNQALASSLVTSFKGNVQYTDAILTWNTGMLADGSVITLERSRDAVSYAPLYTYSYTRDAAKNFRDNPGTGRFYYRLRIEPAGGGTIFSHVVKLDILQEQQGFKIYPTLTKPGETITIENITAGIYTATIRNINSAVVYRSVFNAYNAKATIILPAVFATGTYYLTIEKDGSQLFGRGQLLVQNR